MGYIQKYIVGDNFFRILHCDSVLLFCYVSMDSSQVFSIFQDCKISVDVVASSDVSLSLTLDNKQTKSGSIPELLVQSNSDFSMQIFFFLFARLSFF